jgi:hypothetical protein
VAASVRRETLTLVLAVLVVDAVFAAIYLFARLRHAAGGMKLIFTVVWTLVTLAVVVRGLSRIRTARIERKSA